MKAVAERELMERTQASVDGEEVLARKRASVIAAAPARVLLVDEEVAQRHRTMVALARAGISAAEAGNAGQALALLKKNRFDTVIADMNMAGHVNGLGLASCVRSLWPRTKVIIVSGLVRLRKADLSPGVSFLARPIPDARLIAAVHGATRNR
ncbi:hypothetical protein ATY81_22425 [Rhizobium sp. R72]|nr:hypothetical protein ATY81_22425 [Rhizobium sp. R72]OWW02528.1 hypothetical protein ATY80_22425 [Rhizobium sp. R711]